MTVPVDIAPAPAAAHAAALSQLDIAYGAPLGLDSSREPLKRRAYIEPADAFDNVLLAALQRPPCVISFSGGRDSSALLASATRVARREGLPLPVPVTLRFPGSVAADEDSWQRTVITHLQLDEWVRLDIVDDEFDVVGPVARECLSRHGLLWPFNAHFHWPIMKTAAGGSVVTGFGGDEIARSSTTARAEQVLAGRRRPQAIDSLVVGLALSPRPVRAAVLRKRFANAAHDFPWLTPDGLVEVGKASADFQARLPLGWSRVIRAALWRARYFTVCQQNFATMGKAAGVEVFHPFVAAEVLDSLASAGGFGGLGSRADIMRLLCGSALPERVIGRGSKGSFDDPTWTDTARIFAREWSGGGVDQHLVEVQALREHWLGGQVNLVSGALIQAAWLHDNRGANHSTAATHPATVTIPVSAGATESYSSAADNIEQS